MNNENDKWQRRRKMFHKNRGKTKWCNFHGDHIHMTKNYIHFKDNLEVLIRRGYFTHNRVQTNEGDLAKSRDENI